MNDLVRCSIVDLSSRLRAGRASASELVAACLEQIRRQNPQLNAFITVLGEEALAEARRADLEMQAGRVRGPLHGIPISLKDLVDVAGVPTTAASRVRATTVARRDAQIVTRLRRAGAVVIGKTNLHEFAFGTTGEDSAFGPTRHWIDPARSAGGSSSGSAVAVATGMSPASIGTDTGGSIRIPAAACGLVGLKPTWGELPMAGIVPLSPSLDHVGPIARTVEDAWLVYDAMRGVSPPATRVPERPPASLRLGLPRRFFLDVLDEGVHATFEDALVRLRRAGITIEEVDIAHSGSAAAIYLLVQLPEASAWHAATLDRQPQDYQPPVRLRLELGRYVLAEDYVRAQQARTCLRCEVDAALGGLDALVLPTLPIAAPRLGAATLTVGGHEEPVRALMLRMTQLFNLTGHPAITLPCGSTPDGLPCGLQLAGRINRTEQLLSVAACCEHALAGG